MGEKILFFVRFKCTQVHNGSIWRSIHKSEHMYCTQKYICTVLASSVLLCLCKSTITDTLHFHESLLTQLSTSQTSITYSLCQWHHNRVKGMQIVPGDTLKGMCYTTTGQNFVNLDIFEYHHVTYISFDG